MIFGNQNKKLRSEEYDELLKKYLNLQTDHGVLVSKVNVLSSDVNDLRGKFNRKLAIFKKEAIGEPEESEDLNNIKPLTPW